jgi:hypothetical protein
MAPVFQSQPTDDALPGMTPPEGGGHVEGGEDVVANGSADELAGDGFLSEAKEGVGDVAVRRGVSGREDGVLLAELGHGF